MKTAPIFNSHMIFQREKEIHIWGTGKDGESVSVALAGAEPLTTADCEVSAACSAQTSVRDGHWHIILPPMKIGRNIQCRICGETETITFDDISIGDVFLAGGQSNMEFWMRYDADINEVRNTCENPDIRFFDCPEISYEGQDQDFDYSRMGFWRTCDTENIEYFTAIGYYFAREIQQSRHIPVGIIGCNWGGTVAASWMDEAHLAKHGQVWLDEYCEGLKSIPEGYVVNFRKNPMNDRGNPFADSFGETMLFGLSHEEQLKFMEQAPPMDEYNLIGPCHQNRPCGLYELMLQTIAPFPISGVLWYQGESDELHADIYKGVLSDLVDCWRELWNDTLPFFCVQLAPFGVWLACSGDNYPIVRQQQYELSQEKDGVYFISSSDAGMYYDIHPKKKQPIGYRLALSARNHLYGENIPCEAPIMYSAEWKDGMLLLHFANTYDGLTVQGNLNALQLFETNETTGSKEISSDSYQCTVYKEYISVKLPDALQDTDLDIAFAWTPYYEVNLYNSAGIPAMPARCTVTNR